MVGQQDGSGERLSFVNRSCDMCSDWRLLYLVPGEHGFRIGPVDSHRGRAAFKAASKLTTGINT
jgi:hypothetical protein